MFNQDPEPIPSISVLSHSGNDSNLAYTSPQRYVGPEKQNLDTTPDRFTWYTLPTFMSRGYPDSGLRCCSNEWFSTPENASLTPFWYVASFKCTIIEHREQSKEIGDPTWGFHTLAMGRIKDWEQKMLLQSTKNRSISVRIVVVLKS